MPSGPVAAGLVEGAMFTRVCRDGGRSGGACGYAQVFCLYVIYCGVFMYASRVGGEKEFAGRGSQLVYALLQDVREEFSDIGCGRECVEIVAGVLVHAWHIAVYSCLLHRLAVEFAGRGLRLVYV